MNLSPKWAAVLQKAGHEAVLWSDIGAENVPDEEIAEWAHGNDRIVLTGDLDFGKLLALRGLRRPSVVQLRCADTRHRTVGRAVMATITVEADALEAGAFMTSDGRRARIRQLPFTGS